MSKGCYGSPRIASELKAFKTLKTGLMYQHQYPTKKEAALSIFEYLETWYSRNIRHQNLNNLTLLEYEKLTTQNFNHAA